MLPPLPRLTAGPSIYDLIRAHMDVHGRLDDDDVPLPDEPDADAGGIRWAPGARDGALGGSAGDAAHAEDVVALLLAASQTRTAGALGEFYALIQTQDTLAYVDSTIELLVAARPDLDAVHDVGTWLATTASHRGPVKLGLALIGMTGIREAGDFVRTLGTHDEFTLFAAVAIRKGSVDADHELWQLARVVEGWGRIQCVVRLRDFPMFPDLGRPY